MTAASVVEVVRGRMVESRHRVHAAVVDAAGRLRASSGNPELVAFFRSAAKPFQALPLVDDGAVERFGLSEQELALCCGSHSGEPEHVRAVEQILCKVGAVAEELACGPHPPFYRPARDFLAEQGLEPGRLHNNCSGKHAGMIALARVHGWDTAGYNLPEHPVQTRLLREVGRWTGCQPEEIQLGTDGCGVPSFALSVSRMARGYAALAAAARRGEGGAGAVVEAMIAHPSMVAGTGRLCTDLMRVAGGRLFAKLGAEGVYAVGVPGAELGVALKIEDGGRRALGPAVLGVLSQLDLISETDLGRLDTHAFPELSNTLGEPVGYLRSAVRLRKPPSSRR
ncbi:MAG: asparaginase [Longimicrobiaceae bacterium]